VLFSNRYRYLFVLLLGGYSYLNIYYTVGEKLFSFSIPGLHLFLILLFVVAAIWELNRMVEKLVVSRSSFKSINPLLLVFGASLINVLISCSIGMVALYLLLNRPFPISLDELTLLAVFGFRVNLFLNCINAIVYYMNRYRTIQVEAEQLRIVSVEAQFEALRNQINPHFLFNCFNALSSLVYKDADTSAKFIAQLSNVYRYLLYNQGNRVVTLSAELDFTQSYFYLLTIRFSDSIFIDNQIKGATDRVYIAPAVLQMLVENAIKHNVVSRKNPLEIILKIEDDAVVVINTIHEKTVKEASTGIGLKNIINRYRLLTDKPVTVERTPAAFTVKIPLLQIELT
jgi:two-component system, LytTR family, sensor kinase